MGAAFGRKTDALAFFAALAEAPHRYDFYQTLRKLECLYREQPRWGQGLRPVDERVRLGQDPDLSFAPAPLAAFEPGREGKAPRLQVRLFGLLGPNGPLPIHITEYARERLRNAGDATLSRFLDLFHHRFLTLFYRAWAQAQPHVNRDRPEADRFAGYVGAFIGISPQAFRHRDTLPDAAKLFHVGALMPYVRHAEGLAAILQHFFRVPVRIEEHVGHWMRLGAGERTSLRREGATLGAGAVVGRAVWDRQHKFRIHLGPLTLAQYESFLPVPPRVPVSPRVRSEGSSDPSSPSQHGEGGLVSPACLAEAERRRKPPSGEGGLRKLVDWVRLYLCFELDWDVRLRLEKNEVPSLTLGGRGRLGWTTWLGERRTETDADELLLDAESVVGRV
ncbi:MAG: type VI secretion system baseplate subunit TssG [Luteitalea sp.]|nr:type VI secretion system baseplate subunit TssG [Luteitalea sp.]